MGMNANIARAKKDCIFFGEYYFPHLTPQKTGSFHRNLIKLVEEKENDRVDILAPRGHAKSTWLSIIYPLWKIVFNRDINIIICSDIADQAEMFLRTIKDELEWNVKLIDHYGAFRPKEKSGGQTVWRANDITIIRNERGKEPTIVCGGTGKKIIGRRADLIIVDDPLNDENTESEKQREKTEKWFKKTLTPILRPATGRMIVIGTKKHPLDLHYTLKNSPAYKQFKYKAINNGYVLWPELWSYDLLIKKKNEVGSLVFAQEYQNEDTDEETSLFNIDMIEKCCDSTISYETNLRNTRNYLGIYVPLHTKSDQMTEYKNKTTTAVEIKIDKENKRHYRILLNERGTTIKKILENIHKLIENEWYDLVVFEQNVYDMLLVTNLMKFDSVIEGHDKNGIITVHSVIPKIINLLEEGSIIIPYKNEQDKVETNNLKEAFRLYMQNEPNETITALCLAEHAVRVSEGEAYNAEIINYSSW